MPPSPSPSGFASLRARFEQNKQDSDTSPPSRGRSPAGSITSEQARPLSKIRTNFVAVEPSGHMSHHPEVSGVASGTLDGSLESKIFKKSNEPVSEGSTGLGHGAIETVLSNGNQHKGQTVTRGDATSKSKPSAGSEDSNSQETTQGLGSILKGSPFEEEDCNREEALGQALKKKPSQKSDPSAKSANPSTSKQSSESTKASRSAKPHLSTAAAKSQPLTTQKPKAEASESATEPNGRPRDTLASTTLDKIKSVLPSTVQTNKGSAKKGTETDASTRSSAKNPTATRGINSAKPPPKQLVTKPATKASEDAETKDASLKSEHIEQNGQNSSGALTEASGNSKEASKTTANKLSSLAKSVSKPIKKATTSSAPSSKPRPKSPTKSGKLPAAATAGTTSSNAKHEEAGPQSRSPSRQNNAPAVSKARLTSLAKPRTVRASLPANSKPLDKPKAKPRASLAPGSAPSGSFLERMMRPTQSSAQKVHEKAEPQSPPRRNTGSGNHAAKSKRKSGGSSDDKIEDGQAEEALPTDAKSQAADAPMDLTPLPLTDGAAVQSNNIAQEIQNAAPVAEPIA